MHQFTFEGTLYCTLKETYRTCKTQVLCMPLECDHVILSAASDHLKRWNITYGGTSYASTPISSTVTLSFMVLYQNPLITGQCSKQCQHIPPTHASSLTVVCAQSRALNSSQNYSCTISPPHDVQTRPTNPSKHWGLTPLSPWPDHVSMAQWVWFTVHPLKSAEKWHMHVVTAVSHSSDIFTSSTVVAHQYSHLTQLEEM